MTTQISQELTMLFQSYFQETFRRYLTEFPILSTIVGYQIGWNDPDGNPIHGQSGKQIRPLLALLSCGASGQDPKHALALGTAIELIHTFSLIHDDVMDVSETRRGRPSVWKAWGVNQAINSGDGAYGLSFQILASEENPAVDAKALLQAVAMLGKACVDTVQGQMMDIDFETREVVSVEEYIRMTSLKTGPLIGLALGGGALMAGVAPYAVAALDQTGRNLGVAFQMQDDILGIWGNPYETGKSAIDDLVQKKKSLPVLWALQNILAPDRDHLHELYANPAPLDTKIIHDIFQILTKHEVKQIVQEQAQEKYQEVVDDILTYYPASVHRGELLKVVEFIVNRSH